MEKVSSFYFFFQYIINASGSIDPDGYSGLEYYFLCRHVNDVEFEITYHNVTTTIENIEPGSSVPSLEDVRLYHSYAMYAKLNEKFFNQILSYDLFVPSLLEPRWMLWDWSR